MNHIEIVGGGLAGLSLGLALRQAGVPVTLTEAGSYPRHRVCGEFIAGLSDQTITRLGLGPVLHDAQLHHEVAWFIGPRLLRTQHLPEPARALSRHTLDARLAAAFVQAGGKLLTNVRVPPAADRPGLVCTTGRRRADSPWLGLKIHALNLPLQRDLELHLGTNAYLGLTKVEDGRVNLCGLFRRRDLQAKGPGLILAYLNAAGLGALADRLARAQFDDASFSAVAGVDFDRQIPASGHLALGDAGAMIPPFTGNGMAMAFQGAELALNPLVLYAHGRVGWSETSATIHHMQQSRFRTRLATAGFLHPFLLEAPRQRWLSGLARTGLLPLRPLYSLLH